MSNNDPNRPIKLDEAKTLIDNYLKLSGEIQKTIKPSTKERDMEELECFRTLKNNAFIFDKEAIMKLFKEDSQAEHLALVLGAHTKTVCDTTHPKGSFTLVAMTVKEDEQGDFSCIDDPNEYPKCEEVETEVQYAGKSGSLVLKRTQLQK